MPEDSKTAEYVMRVVYILTAILSEQEDEAYNMVLESDTTELFSALTGLLLSSLATIADMQETSIQSYLQELGLAASRSLN